MQNKIFTIMVLGISTSLALFIGGTVPLLGTSIAAILIGAIIRHTPIYKILDSTIVGFVSSYLLKAGIVLLGFTLSLRILNEVGIGILAILASVIVVSILSSYLFNKGLKVNNEMGLLIGIGTSICGGSAIVASAPIIEAEDEDIAVSITTMFIYSMLALLILPALGKISAFTDQMYGIFSGAAVNDTASVVATAFDWSHEAGGIATVVKLVRTLFIVPVTICVIYYKYYKQRRESLNKAEKMSISWDKLKSIVPIFVVFFVMAVIFASIVPIPESITRLISTSSKLLMTVALVTIGFGVHIQQIKKAGIKPVLLGAGTWASVLAISLVLIKVLYG